MLRLLPLLFVAALALAGCRESLTSPLGPDAGDDPAIPPVLDPDPDLRSIYVKAPYQLREGQTAGARAEPLHGVDHYRWTFSGSGEVFAEPDDPDGHHRIVSLLADEAGMVYVTVRAYDAAGEPIAVGTASFPIVEH